MTNYARLEARVDADIYDMLKKAAQLEGRSLTDFVVSVASTAAKKTIMDATVLQLSVKDQTLFAHALTPTQPNQKINKQINTALIKAFDKHNQLISADENTLDTIPAK